MEKLLLKHIVGYLPCGLKIQLLKKDGLIEKMCMGFTKIGVLVVPENGHGLMEIHIDTIKPILRPLSDLTKEIEVNGEKFIPMDVLCSIEASEEEDFKLYGKIPEIWEFMIKTKPRYWDYWQVQKLYEWHFDIHGLIEKGLAIDLNTLDNGVQ